MQNSDVIRLLTERSKAIENLNLAHFRRLNDQIKICYHTEGIQNTVHSVFITFETHFQLKTATKLLKNVRLDVLETGNPYHKLLFENCINPGSIIWANRNITTRNQRKNTIWVILFLLLVGLLSFVIIQMIKMWIFDSQAKYSYATQCKDIQQMFAFNQTLFQEQAIYDQQFVESKDSTGIYQCYCQLHSEFQISKEFNGKDLCLQYKLYLSGGKFLRLAAGLSIGLANSMSIVAVNWAVPKIRLHSSANQLKLQVFIGFFMAYFNLTFSLQFHI